MLKNYLKVILVSLPIFATLSAASENKTQRMIASYYGPGFHGKRTANGEQYNQYGFTAAHKTLPFGTELKVNYGDRYVFVRINDRGPFIYGRDLDLSYGAAKQLGFDGVAPVDIKILKKGKK